MAFCVNPFTRTVTRWAPHGAFLPALRQTIGCLQIDSILTQPHLCAWVDNFGLLKPDNRFFRFRESRYRFAGVVVFTSTDNDGMPISAEGLNLEEVAAEIDWCEGIHVTAIREELRITETELGPWPRVVRITEFNEPVPDVPQGPFDVSAHQVPVEAPTAVPGLANGLDADVPAMGEVPVERPSTYWTVLSDDETDSFIASEDDGDGEPTGRVKQFGEMHEVAEWFKQNDAERIEDDPALPDEVVARFRMPA